MGKECGQKRGAVILSELGANQLVNPNLVLIEQRSPDKNQLQIRGDFDHRRIELFLKKKHLLFEMKNDYLTIFKPQWKVKARQPNFNVFVIEFSVFLQQQAEHVFWLRNDLHQKFR